MSLSYTFNHLGSIWYHSEPLGPLFPKPVSWLGLFFEVSYSKPALATNFLRFFLRGIFISIIQAKIEIKLVQIKLSTSFPSGAPEKEKKKCSEMN